MFYLKIGRNIREKIWNMCFWNNKGLINIYSAKFGECKTEFEFKISGIINYWSYKEIQGLDEFENDIRYIKYLISDQANFQI